MAERVLTPYPIYTPGERTVAPLTRLFLYAMADTDRTTPLEVLDPITRAPLPGGFTTDAEGMTPYCILRGALLAQDDQTVQAVDDRDRLSTQRIPLDPARILSDEQASAMIGEAVEPLATSEALSAGLGRKINIETYTAGMSAKADKQYVDDALGGKADAGHSHALGSLSGTVTAAQLGADDAPVGTVLSRTASGTAWTTPPAGTGEGVSDASVAAVVPSGATAQAIASLVGVVVRATDAEATAAASQFGVLGLVVDEVVGTGGGGDPEPPADTTAPTITAPAWPTLTVGSAVDPLVLSADEPVTWSMSGPLPAGLSWNAASGTVSGTPTATGTGSVTFTGTDAASNAAQVSWSWSVSAAPIEWVAAFSDKLASTDADAAGITGADADNALGGTMTVRPTISVYQSGNTLLPIRTATTSGTYAGGQAYGVGMSPEVVGGAGTDAIITWAGVPSGPRGLDVRATSGYNAALTPPRMDAGCYVLLYYNPVTRARVGVRLYNSGAMLEVLGVTSPKTGATRSYTAGDRIEVRGTVDGDTLTVTMRVIVPATGQLRGTSEDTITTPWTPFVDAPAVAVHYNAGEGQGYGSLDDLVVYTSTPVTPERTVLLSEKFSSHDETQEQITARAPDNYAGGTITTPPTVGTITAATAGTLVAATTPGQVAGFNAGAGLRLGAGLTAGVDVALKYAVGSVKRHVEFTLTSPAGSTTTNLIVSPYAGNGATYVRANVAGTGVTVAGRNGFPTTAVSSSSVPVAQGDRIRVEAQAVGADTQMTVTNVTTGASATATFPGADLTTAGTALVGWPVQYGKGSLDDLVVYEGGAA